MTAKKARGDRGRRRMDIVGSAAALAVLSPLVPIVAALIKVDSPGPALFRQRRIGRDGEPFEILKLRTMVVDANRIGPAVGGRHDPRVTRVGRMLRATKLDELPQLYNVLRGDMTLVGPRAEVPELIEHYNPEQLGILAVTPGLTGVGQLYFTLYQANELDDVLDPTDHHIRHQLGPKVGLDLAYAANRSWRSDLALIAYTLVVMAGLRGERFAPAALRRVRQNAPR